MILPNQPYPELPAWEDLAPILVNGWGVPGAAQGLQGIALENTVTLFGRVQIGSHQTMGALPAHLRAVKQVSVPAQILGGPSCLVEVQGLASAGGWQLNLSAFSLGMTNSEMLAAFSGKYLSLAGSYPRRQV